MSKAADRSAQTETALVVDGDVLVRTSVSSYLRECGYKVIEAVNTDEALAVLQFQQIKVHILLTDANAPGTMNGFGLANWVRANISDVDVVLASSIVKVAGAAAAICDDGPLKRPYDPQLLLERIKQMRAARTQSKGDQNEAGLASDSLAVPA
jgi:DNA-binding response OmpR family regulator